MSTKSLSVSLVNNWLGFGKRVKRYVASSEKTKYNAKIYTLNLGFVSFQLTVLT